MKRNKKKLSHPKINKKLISAEYLKSKAEYMKRLEQKRIEKQKRHDQYQKDLEEFTDWHKEQKNWIEKLKRAKTRKEYNQILKGFKQLRVQFKKKFKNCVPPPPPSILINKMKQSRKSIAEDRCHEGYKEGYQQGKFWAKLVLQNSGVKKSKLSGKESLNESLNVLKKSNHRAYISKMGCLLDFLGQRQTLKNICAIRGAKQGYIKWWDRFNSKGKMDRYLRRKVSTEQQNKANLEYYKRLSRIIEYNKKTAKIKH